jgi:hypothetical protein
MQNKRQNDGNLNASKARARSNIRDCIENEQLLIDRAEEIKNQ